MHEWITRLKNAIEKEFAKRPTVLTLATVSRNGSPRARSVVCRKIGDDGSLWISSDARSKKGGQIRRRRSVELVAWLPTLRLQYRLRGEARVVDRDHPVAQELWQAMSPQSRAMFFWPTMDVSADSADPPAIFEAIAVYPSRVEELDLNVEPHRAWTWKRKKE